MKITYIHQYFNTPNMPGSTRSYEVAKRLIADGHEVTMITSDRSINASKKVEVVDGIKVYWIPVKYDNDMNFLRRLIAFFKYMVFASIVAPRYEADLIFATSTPLSVIIPGYLTARIRRAKLIFEVRDMWPDVPIALGFLNNYFMRKLAYSLEKFAYTRSDHIIALSNDMKSQVINKNIVPNKISVITNGADVVKFRPRKRFDEFDSFLMKRDVKTLLYCGTIGRVNNVLFLVQVAAHLLHRGDLQILVIGSGSEFDRTRQYAINKKVLGKNFFMKRAVSKHEMYDVLSVADMACSLTIDNDVMNWNSANKFFDGLAAGCVFFTNYGGWQAQLLTRYSAGGCLTHDAGQGAKIIEWYLNRPNVLQSHQKNARKLAEKKFSHDVLHLEFKKVLLKMENDK